ncbi:hypothetical protein CsSME_00021062 [Camellia sinensis var. sinensis]
MDEDFMYSDMASSSNESNILKYRNKTCFCGQKAAIKESCTMLVQKENANSGIGASLLTQLMKVLILFKGDYLKAISRMCIQDCKYLKITKDI